MTSHRLSTARARLVATLAEEILQHPEGDSFSIASEHQLCRRFQISRVTVRLALGDLENRGLIYRRHGKGTFAHGRARQVYRDIGFLLKDEAVRAGGPVDEMIRGAQAVMAPLRAGVVLLNRGPEDWRHELAVSLAGVVVVPGKVGDRDLQVLRERNLPFILALPSLMPGPKLNFGLAEAAREMTERLLRAGHRHFALLSSGHAALDVLKRDGVLEPLRAAGIDAAHVAEFCVEPGAGAVAQVMRKFLELRPRPTALVAFDDTLAATAASHLRREGGLRIPEELSLVALQDGPLLRELEPGLSVVGFDFFAAGQRAAEALNRSSLTGMPVTDLFFEPAWREGGNAGSAAAQNGNSRHGAAGPALFVRA